MDLSVLSFQGIRHARNLHPLFVHFPLALLPTAFLFYSLGYALDHRRFQFAGRAVLALVMISTMLAWVTGFQAESTLGVVHPRSELLRAHIRFGTVLMAVGIFLFAWSRAHVDDRPKNRWAFLALLGLAVFLTAVTGDLGGQLVYLRGASVQDKGNPKTF